MDRTKIYLKNLTANWVGYVANLLIMFFMSPFVIHSLGDVKYGIWSIMMTFTGYLGLVEIGTRGGVGRFINYYLGKGDIQRLNGIINTGLAIFVATGLVMLMVSLALAFVLEFIFPKIPDQHIVETRIVLFLVAVNVWVSFLTAVFRQVLEAHERFELRNAIDLGVLFFRSGLFIIILISGYGIVALGIIHTIGGISGLFLSYFLARKIFSNLKITPKHISKYRFTELFGFSVWAFIGNISYRLLYTTDNIVIGIFLGPKWVTYYAVGGMLLFRSRALINQFTQVFSPKLMQDCAKKDFESLQVLFQKGSNLNMVICILVFIGMISFGKEFIILWMGDQFKISYDILAILTAGTFLSVAFQMGGPIYAGLNKVKIQALLNLTQGFVNLILTLFFVMYLKWGIIGVAWGSFYPRILWSIILGVIAMRLINIKPLNFFHKYILKWLYLSLSFYLLCYVVNLLVLSDGWINFFIKIIICTIIYIPLAWFTLFNLRERIDIIKQMNCFIKSKKN